MNTGGSHATSHAVCVSSIHVSFLNKVSKVGIYQTLVRGGGVGDERQLHQLSHQLTETGHGVALRHAGFWLQKQKLGARRLNLWTKEESGSKVSVHHEQLMSCRQLLRS